ncbi:MAG TPA: hypothetical protein VIY28_09845 [Pseudonocardiaceae bacterium]
MPKPVTGKAVPAVIDHDPTSLYQLRDGIYAPDLLVVAVADVDLFTWLAQRGRAAAHQSRATSAPSVEPRNRAVVTDR